MFVYPDTAHLAQFQAGLNLGYGLEVTGVTNGKMADAGIRKGFIILKANGVPMKTDVYKRQTSS